MCPLTWPTQALLSRARSHSSLAGSVGTVKPRNPRAGLLCTFPFGLGSTMCGVFRTVFWVLSMEERQR